jgi:hypothetical protein
MPRYDPEWTRVLVQQRLPVSIRMMRSAWCMEIRRIDEAFVPSRNLVLKSVELEALLGELKRFPCANHSCARMHPKKPASDREKKNTRPYWQLLQTADRLCCGTAIAYTHTHTDIARVS